MQFTVMELYYHDAEVHEDGTLFYDSSGDGGRERIFCSECDRTFSDDDFAGVAYD